MKSDVEGSERNIRYTLALDAKGYAVLTNSGCFSFK